MSNTARTVLSSQSSNINIDQLWPALRQKQYQNALCDLKIELENLTNLPNIAPDLKVKIERSLEKITQLVKKYQKT